MKGLKFGNSGGGAVSPNYKTIIDANGQLNPLYAYDGGFYQENDKVRFVRQPGANIIGIDFTDINNVYIECQNYSGSSYAECYFAIDSYYAGISSIYASAGTAKQVLIWNVSTVTGVHSIHLNIRGMDGTGYIYNMYMI